jgi:hypothetical protein
MSGVRQIIVEEDMDHPLIGTPVLDEMGFRGESASGLRAGQIPPARLQPHWRGAIGYELAAFRDPVTASTKACGHSRVSRGLAGCSATDERNEHEAVGADQAKRS